MKTGIYQIRNSISNKLYIGSAAGRDGFIGRWRLHKYQLNKECHHSIVLQRAWNKYGADAFVFEVLLYCDPGGCLTYEQFALDCYQPEYNICKVAGSSLGVKRRQESIEKRLRNMPDQSGVNNPFYQKSHSDDAKNKMSVAKKKLYIGEGNPNFGKTTSEEVKHKMRLKLSKLTELDVIGIKQLLFDGKSQTSIACEYNIARQTVSKISTGKRFNVDPSVISCIKRGVKRYGS